MVTTIILMLSKYQVIYLRKISLIAYDLDGFGKNSNSGYWFSLNHHIKDLQNEILNLKNKFPEKKFF